MDLIVKRANQLITLRSASHKPIGERETRDLGVIEDGAIAIDRGRIVAADKTSRIESRFKSEETVVKSGKTVMPGFVDSHTHLVFQGAREEEFELRLQGASYMEVLEKGGGILKTVEQTRKASKEELATAGMKRLDTMLNHGTTTVEAKSGYGLTVDDETKCLEVIKELHNSHPVDVVPTFLGAHAVPSEYKGRTDEYVELLAENMIPGIAARALAEFCDVFCENGIFDYAQSKIILEAGLENGLVPKVHADELTDAGGAQLAAEVGAISAEHLLFASESGLKAMAEKGVIAVLLPAASFSLMTGRYADARKIIQLGVPVALGSDFNPSCWSENMQLTIGFACRGLGVTPAEAITAATINAAYSMNRAEEVGSLEKGKKADVVILDVPNYRYLGYRFGVNLVDMVIKEGKTVLGERE
ncbi:MAG: imidazolonepropionase [Candidatus Bathyarchaeota archaeon]|nr:MAG: imidazolonepropionase [Candidatus Bathyarchaeota archaeon]